VTSYDGAQKKLYIDGRLDAAQNASGNMNSATNDIIIGGTARTDSVKRWWNGAIDDVRIYDRALTQEEIWSMLEMDADIEYLKLVINNWLTAGPNGDLNSDGIVNLLDYTIMAQQYN
jgi:hypothetical protein